MSGIIEFIQMIPKPSVKSAWYAGESLAIERAVVTSQLPVALWFLIGGLAAIALYKLHNTFSGVKR